MSANTLKNETSMQEATNTISQSTGVHSPMAMFSKLRLAGFTSPSH